MALEVACVSKTCPDGRQSRAVTSCQSTPRKCIRQTRLELMRPADKDGRTKKEKDEQERYVAAAAAALLATSHQYVELGTTVWLAEACNEYGQ